MWNAAMTFWLSYIGSLLTLLFSIIVFCDTPKAFSHVKRSHDFLTVIYWLFVNPIVLNYCFFVTHPRLFRMWNAAMTFWLSYIGSLLTLLFSIIVFCDTPKAIFRMWNAAMTFWLSYIGSLLTLLFSIIVFLWHTQGFFACETQPWLSDCHILALC